MLSHTLPTARNQDEAASLIIGKNLAHLALRGVLPFFAKDYKRTDSQRHSPYSTAARLRAHAGLSHFRTVFVPNATWVEIRASNP